MGLDMFAYATESDITEIDFDCPEDSVEILYWRKHPNLHGWMRKLYARKGGTDSEFNCNTARLDTADLDLLEQAILHDALPLAGGFFFGTSDRTERPDDLAFLHKARAEIATGPPSPSLVRAFRTLPMVSISRRYSRIGQIELPLT